MAERVAIRQFPAEQDGKTVIVLAGTRFPSTDPIVKATPGMFESVKRSTRKRETKR
jgi:hypothetical protein